jgi:hypothetical protein
VHTQDDLSVLRSSSGLSQSEIGGALTDASKSDMEERATGPMTAALNRGHCEFHACILRQPENLAT